MTVVPEKEMTGVVLTNLSGVPAADMLTGAIHLIHDKDFSADPITFKQKLIPTESLERYSGSFTSDEGMKVSFNVKENQLMLDSHDQTAETTLRYIGEDSFITSQNSLMRFIKNDQGNVVRVFYSSRQISKDV